MAIGLVVCGCLWLAGEARGARYTVVNCEAGAGWDADWADTTGATRFRPGTACEGGGDDHLISYTVGGGTLPGLQFARWRWTAAPGTYLTKVSGIWWHELHDGMEQMIGPFDSQGNWVPGVWASATELTQRPFQLDFAAPVAGIEDRLICARPVDSWCSLGEASASGIRNVAIEVEDEHPPTAAAAGELTESGWHRGVEDLVVSGSDLGSGVRYGETLIDGARAAISEYWCASSYAGGALVALWMKPCVSLQSDRESIDTARFADGRHQLVHCAHDFAGSVGCGAPVEVAIDNGAPAAPKPVTTAGGDGWRRRDAFDLGWTEPDQGGASPIVGATWRLTGPGDYDSGPHYVAGAGIAALPGLVVPGPGEWHLRLWLRDEAGNESEASAADVPLRFDDQPPSVVFADGGPAGGRVSAPVTDPLSGPAAGTISYRRADGGGGWTDLPTALHGEGAGRATLSAPLPDLGAGTWAFRVEAADAAGNGATATQRADGSPMTVTGPVEGGKAGADGGPGRDGSGGQGARGKDGAAGGGRDGKDSGGRTRTRLLVRLRGGKGGGTAVTLPFGAPARLTGRLVAGAPTRPTTAARPGRGAGLPRLATGAGLVGRRVKVLVVPSHGALAPRTVRRLRTGARGAFSLRLPPGASRRVVVSFPGNRSLASAERRSLRLRVRAGLTLKAWPEKLRTGQTVHFSGRVRARGARISRRGKLVAIQYLEADTGRWRPVLVTRTDGQGRFDARYRFRYITDAARIRLRATALPEADWPYAPGSSAPVTIEVDGG
ncbi:MAG TPA: carboxypeptidase-like regulatory domain-containing protein [Solirubrobacterales bacterium]|jgi:hypothetical protein|nr:carboxypeptidase-like regulatory domain-containing protein [Solirubrobacterales bacterium]